VNTDGSKVAKAGIKREKGIFIIWTNKVMFLVQRWQEAGKKAVVKEKFVKLCIKRNQVSFISLTNKAMFLVPAMKRGRKRSNLF